MSRGMQPLGIDVAVVDREEERDELVTIFRRYGGMNDDQVRFLGRHDGRTRGLQEIVQAVWIGLAWLRCLSTAGNRRTKDLTRQWEETYAHIAD